MLPQRPFSERREGRIEFLGEQDGPPERVLKALLRAEFQHHPVVRRAYLAQVGFAPGASRSVALCIAPSSAEGPKIVSRIGELFAQFSADAYLDILFPDEEQETDLKRVCHPFFAV